MANGFAEESRTFGLCSLALFTAISPPFRQPLFKGAQEVRCSRPPRRPPVSPVSECHSQDDLCAGGGAISGECDGTARSSRTSGPCQTRLRSGRRLFRKGRVSDGVPALGGGGDLFSHVFPPPAAGGRARELNIILIFPMCERRPRACVNTHNNKGGGVAQSGPEPPQLGVT